jgi:hypothetical protein
MRTVEYKAYQPTDICEARSNNSVDNGIFGVEGVVTHAISDGG